MLGKCGESSEMPLLVEHLNNVFQERTRVLKYKKWVVENKRCKYITVEEKASEVANQIHQSIKEKKVHLFVKRVQQAYLTNFLETMPEDTLLIMMDFAENLMCVAQSEVANKFYYRDIVSLFTAVVYRRINGKLLHRSYGVFCDDKSHDISHVMVALKAIRHAPSPRVIDVDTIPGDPFEGIKRVCYFTDGARQHFKSKNAMFLLGHHEQYFGTIGEWCFHASGHGKSPCDGIGAVLKRLVRRAQLKETYAPGDAPILTAQAIYQWSLSQPLMKTTVCFVDQEAVDEARDVLKQIACFCKPITDITLFHRFTQVGDGKITIRRTAQSEPSPEIDLAVKGNEEAEALVEVSQRILQ